MDKMKSTARGLDIVFRILAILAIVGIIALAVINIAGFAVGYDKFTDPDSVSLTIALGGYHIDAKYLGTPAEIGRTILLVSISAAIGLAAAWYGIRIIRRILAPMKEGQPFSKGTSGDLKKLGWFVIGYGVVYNVFDFFIKSVVARAMISSQAVQTSGAVTYGVEHHLDPTFLIIAFILFLFSYIFRYGEELQQLSDETL